MLQQDLAAATWSLRPSDPADDRIPDAVRNAGDIPATVPGCVHTDLMAAGLLEDPYLANNEAKQLWVGAIDWTYTATFTADYELDAHERVDLACDGLDTIATLRLNGEVIGDADNMYRSWRFDVKPHLKAGENRLEIRFTSPVAYAEEQAAKHGALPRNGGARRYKHHFNYVRKLACNYGWDWGPEVPTCGVWAPIRLEAWSKARIDRVRPLVREATPERAIVEVHVDLPCVGTPPDVTVRLSRHGTDSTKTGQSPFVLQVDHPELWWPHNHGDQPLYDLDVTLPTGQKVSRRIGLRTTQLVTTPDDAPVGDPVPDAQGEQMTLLVNGKPVYCKGANWIPDDCFVHRVTPERYRTRVQTARDANMNMLRVWGGGLYETDAFYEACDELGVLVWQDFLFACACYPEDEATVANIEAEVRDNVARLSSHASLAIWNGCNENIWGAFDWGPQWVEMRESGREWGLRYYLEILPRLIEEIDPVKPYWPASPYSGSMDRHPNANEYGNRHMWDVWHGEGKYHNYLGHYPRMATEFGYHGPPCWPTLDRSIPPEERRWDSKLMLVHNKNGRDGQIQTNERMGDDFVPPPPETGKAFDDWLYLAQVMQARALSMGIEWFRALFPWNQAAVYWQYNDCWPVSSWSCLDGDGGRKPLWYASRRFFAPRLVTIKPRRATTPEQANDALCVYLHNDTDEPWTGEAVLKQVDLAGRVLAEHRETVNVAPRSLAKFDVPAEMVQKHDAALVADVTGDRGWWWFAPDKQLAYPEPSFDAKLSTSGDVQTLTLTAQTLLRDVCLFADRLDANAQVSDQSITLLPGESFDFKITGASSLDEAALKEPPVLQMANHFGK